MIAPASTLRDLIEGRSLGAFSNIQDLLNELPVPMPAPMPYFQTPVSLSPIPAMVVPSAPATNQERDAAIVDTTDTTIEDSTRRLAGLLKTRRNSNLKVAIYASPEDSTYKIVAKHLRAFKPTVETIPALLPQAPGEPAEKFRSRALGLVKTILADADEDTNQLNIMVTDALIVNLVRAWIYSRASFDLSCDSRWLSGDVPDGQLSAVYTHDGVLKFRPDISGNRTIPRSTRLILVATPNTSTKE